MQRQQERNAYIYTYIHTLLRLPSTGLFSHNVNYYIILVINKRKLIYSSLMKFKIHSELFKIYSKLFCMKHIIKKCLLKAWRTLLVYTAKNLTSFGSYELIKTQIASIFGKKLKFINSFSLNIFFWL